MIETGCMHVTVGAWLSPLSDHVQPVNCDIHAPTVTCMQSPVRRTTRNLTVCCLHFHLKNRLSPAPRAARGWSQPTQSYNAIAVKRKQMYLFIFFAKVQIFLIIRWLRSRSNSSFPVTDK